MESGTQDPPEETPGEDGEGDAETGATKDDTASPPVSGTAPSEAVDAPDDPGELPADEETTAEKAAREAREAREQHAD